MTGEKLIEHLLEAQQRVDEGIDPSPGYEEVSVLQEFIKLALNRLKC